MLLTNLFHTFLFCLFGTCVEFVYLPRLLTYFFIAILCFISAVFFPIFSLMVLPQTLKFSVYYLTVLFFPFKIFSPIVFFLTYMILAYLMFLGACCQVRNTGACLQGVVTFLLSSVGTWDILLHPDVSPPSAVYPVVYVTGI